MSEVNGSVGVKGRVLAILTRKDGTQERLESDNIVTNAGDEFYAEAIGKMAVGGAGAEPTNFTNGSGVFDGVLELYQGAITPAKSNDRADAGTLVGSAKAISTGYPVENDSDSDNTGAGVDVVSYLAEFGTSEGNGANITHCIITNPGVGASEPILMIANFAASFTKVSGDTLKVFVNHTMSGS